LYTLRTQFRKTFDGAGVGHRFCMSLQHNTFWGKSAPIVLLQYKDEFRVRLHNHHKYSEDTGVH